MAVRSLSVIQMLRALIVAANTTADEAIYINVAPQSTDYPYVVLSIVSDVPSPTQDSGSAVDTLRVQIDTYAKNSSGSSGFATAMTIDGAIRTAVSRITDTSTYSHDIDSIQEDNAFTDFIPELEITRVTRDYFVRVK